MKYDTVSVASLIPDDDEAASIITEIDPELSKISSNFKFIGDFDNPTEVIRRAPDFDSVILLLNDELGAASEKLSLDEESIRRLRELKKNRACEANADSANDAEMAQRMELLKHIGPPWAWLHQFTQHNCPRRSYNFIDISSSPLCSDDDEDEELLSPKSSSKSLLEIQEPLKQALSSSSGITVATEGSTDRSSLVSQVLSEVLCRLYEAQEMGKCSICNTQSMIDVIRAEFKDSAEAEKLQRFLQKADEKGVEFKDLNELESFLISQSVKSKAAAVSFLDVAGESDEDQSEVLKECDDPNKIVEIFEASGFEVENKVLEKEVSQKMILGLVDKPAQVPSPDVESVKSIQSDDTTTASAKSATMKEEPKTKEQTIQTTPYLEKQKERLKEKQQAAEVKQSQADEPEIFRSIIPALPGVGPRVSDETAEAFLLYMMRRAREQKGLVYPRNWHEEQCPPMCDNE